MNQPNNVIVLYSKYSPNCQKILDIYDVSMSSFIKLICIDNEKIRKRFLQSKTIKISTVPCVILTYNDGTMEKFEGDNVSDWVIEQIANNNPQPQPQQRTEIVSIEEKEEEEIPPTQEIIQEVQETQRQKSIQEIAAQMSAEREDNFDRMKHGTDIQMQMSQNERTYI